MQLNNDKISNIILQRTQRLVLYIGINRLRNGLAQVFQSMPPVAMISRDSQQELLMDTTDRDRS